MPRRNPPKPRTKPSGRVTLRDIAEACGVARSTVSGIVNQRSDCYASEEVRRRVLEAVDRLGYRPSLTARGLVSGKSSMLGMINTGEDVESATRLTMAFERRARQCGYTTVLAFNPNSADIEDSLARWFFDLGVDGLAVMPSEEGKHPEIRRLADSGFPVVAVDGQGQLDFDIASVNCDHYRGGRMQVEHLIALGRTRFLIADGFHTCHVVERRVAGMLDAIEEAGLSRPKRMEVPYEIQPLDSLTAEGFAFIRGLLEDRRGAFDGVLATGDSLAMAVAGLLLEMGLSIPGDIAVIGHDSHSFGNQPVLPLSSIQLPVEEMGVAACDTLVERIKTGPGSTASPRRAVFIPKLIRRASTVGPAERRLKLAEGPDEPRPSGSGLTALKD